MIGWAVGSAVARARSTGGTVVCVRERVCMSVCAARGVRRPQGQWGVCATGVVPRQALQGVGLTRAQAVADQGRGVGGHLSGRGVAVVVARRLLEVVVVMQLV